VVLGGHMTLDVFGVFVYLVGLPTQHQQRTLLQVVVQFVIQ